MSDDARVALYLARRDAFAALLAAADAESATAWHRVDGRFTGRDAAVAAIEAIDAVYVATRAAFTVIEVEGISPVQEAQTMLDRLADMHTDDGTAPDWKEYKIAREAFVAAAQRHLRALLPALR